MSKLSLHVAYRPSTLKEVLGQDHVLPSLERAIQDRRAKVFLFTGPSGTGKTTLARILANRFSDMQATASNIDEVNAALHSGSDDMRAVVARTLYRAVGKSPTKSVIVDECHRLSSAAWTILLKPTEEPPSHVYWMFCSTEPGKIPKTILTRCLRYDLKPVDEDSIFELIDSVAKKEGMNVNDDVLSAITEEAQGSPRQALVYLEACAYAESAADARRLMRSAAKSKEVIDLCRFLVQPRARSWAEAMKILKALDGTEAESIRLTVLAYLTKIALDSKGDTKSLEILRMIECFSEPYNQSEKMAPLLLSLGQALELGK